MDFQNDKIEKFEIWNTLSTKGLPISESKSWKMLENSEFLKGLIFTMEVRQLASENGHHWKVLILLEMETACAGLLPIL